MCRIKTPLSSLNLVVFPVPCSMHKQQASPDPSAHRQADNNQQPKKKRKKKKKKNARRKTAQDAAPELRPHALDTPGFHRILAAPAAARGFGADIVSLTLAHMSSFSSLPSVSLAKALAALSDDSPSLLPHLHSLDLSSNDGLGDCLEALTKVLAVRGSITSLDLSTCPLGSSIESGGGVADGARQSFNLRGDDDDDDDDDNDDADEAEDEVQNKFLNQFSAFAHAAFSTGVLQLLFLRETGLADRDFSALCAAASASASVQRVSRAPALDAHTVVSAFSGKNLLADKWRLKSEKSSAQRSSPFLHTLDVSGNSLTEVSLSLIRHHLLENTAEIDWSQSPLRPLPADAAEEKIAEKSLEKTSTNSVLFPAFLGLRSLKIGSNNCRTKACVALALLLPRINGAASADEPLQREATGAPFNATEQMAAPRRKKSKKLRSLRDFDLGAGLVRTWTDPPVDSARRVARLLIEASQDHSTNDIATTDALLTELLDSKALSWSVIVTALRDMAAAEEKLLRRGGRTERTDSVSAYKSTQSGFSSSGAESSGHGSGVLHMQGKFTNDHSPLFYCLRHGLTLLTEELLNYSEYCRMTLVHVSKSAQVKTLSGTPFTGSIALPVNVFLIDGKCGKL